MTAREKVLEAERQVRKIVARERSEIVCPFCGLLSLPDQMLCCDEMSTVTHAVLDHIEHLERRDGVKRMLDRLDHMKAKAGLN